MSARLATVLLLLALGIGTRTAAARDICTADETTTDSCTLHGNVAISATATAGEHTPFWMGAGRDGVAAVDGGGMTVRAAVYQAPTPIFGLRRLRGGYGFDVAWGNRLATRLAPVAAYGELTYGRSHLTLGIRPHRMPLNDAQLSTGSFVFGRNALPPALLSWSIPTWWPAFGRRVPIALSGHLAYGFLLDGSWQRRRMDADGARYADGVRYHEKSGYVRLGTDSSAVTFTAGAEMATQFGGTIYHFGTPAAPPIHLGGGLREAFYAFVAKGGSDPTDGDGYGNASGNTVGAWRFALDVHPRRARWNARLYYDHFFEDESAAFDEYGWLDGLLGLELRLPYPALSRIVVEAVRTDYQSGPVYHDHTPEVKEQVSGIDNYYNHGLYPGWQHFGMAMGNALFASPLYDGAHTLTFSANRFRAVHLGVSGHPAPCLSYRVLLTHLRSQGTYALPFAEMQQQWSSLGELTWRLPERIGTRRIGRGWCLTAAFALDRGTRLGNNTAARLTLSRFW